ncbi:MAG: hypothetical protein PF447_07755 [Spirochaetaceae bacterium]|nr:hypothetical protein [Spirochaetaceae bacterium]
MSDTDQVSYIRCFTCGRYFPKAAALEEHFCSRDCMEGYKQCPACRDFFPEEDDRFAGYCSEPCRKASEDSNNRGTR